VGASAAGRDRRGAAEVREGGFGIDPVKVVAGSPEPLRRPSPATGHDAEILSAEDLPLNYAADTCP
jgi:hypothetical protein